MTQGKAALLQQPGMKAALVAAESRRVTAAWRHNQMKLLFGCIVWGHMRRRHLVQSCFGSSRICVLLLRAAVAPMNASLATCICGRNRRFCCI